MRDAQRALRAGRPRRALRGYRRILGAEPNNIELHRRVAKLCLDLGQRRAAWSSLRVAAEGMVRTGDTDEAIGMLREASTVLPRCASLWLLWAKLLAKQGRRDAAIAQLRTAREHFTQRKQRPQAIRILETLCALGARDFDTRLDLARCLVAAGNRRAAAPLLRDLCAVATSTADRRSLRALQFRVAPTPAAAWRWLRAARAPRPALA